MAHHVYTTEGVVLALRPMREADKLVVVLTRDLGLIHAGARGLRKRDSKLASILLEMALVKVSLVRGKNTWRITTAGLVRDAGSELRGRKDALRSLYSVGTLLMRLVRGEEKHPELFHEFNASALKLLDDKETEVSDWETGTVSRILFRLGYLDKDSLDLPRAELIKAINQGLKESGLNNV
ncbi:DNA repair protein RecO [Candidatus Parcubacteria bacterium]|nr:DNA repair protein RecO [Candidatus Parcubacteria bacterium]